MNDQTEAPPAGPGPIPPAGRRCRDCFAYFLDERTGAEGDCRRGPPVPVFEPGPGGDPGFRSFYPKLYPANPACSEFMTAAEWAAFRARYFELPEP